MKTKEELNALKEEVEVLNKKLRELTEDELKQVTGGVNDISGCVFTGNSRVASGGALLTPNGEEPPVKETGGTQTLMPKEPILGPTNYEPIFKDTKPGSILFYDK